MKKMPCIIRGQTEIQKGLLENYSRQQARIWQRLKQPFPTPAVMMMW